MRVLNMASDCLCLDARALLNQFVVAQLDLLFDINSWHSVVQVLRVLVRVEEPLLLRRFLLNKLGAVEDHSRLNTG